MCVPPQHLVFPPPRLGSVASHVQPRRVQPGSHTAASAWLSGVHLCCSHILRRRSRPAASDDNNPDETKRPWPHFSECRPGFIEVSGQYGALPLHLILLRGGRRLSLQRWGRADPVLLAVVVSAAAPLALWQPLAPFGPEAATCPQRLMEPLPGISQACCRRTSSFYCLTCWTWRA